MTIKKIDKTVIKETKYIACWVVLLSVLMQAIFLVAGWWKLTVLWGNLLGGFVAVLNFFLMGLTVQRAVTKEKKEAAVSMKVSQLYRNMLLLVIVMLGFLVPCFHEWSVVVPLFFPRIAIALRAFFENKKTKSPAE
ncbi:MAG: hypothetical protein E7418_01415 [Ruminococcaceae bacterium]|nr:hypothetical protein [Oscillospiraceae bacterium]